MKFPDIIELEVELFPTKGKLRGNKKGNCYMRSTKCSGGGRSRVIMNLVVACVCI